MVINKLEEYSEEQISQAIGTTGTEFSNFYQLKNPIVDIYGNKYWNSEGYYMSLRTEDKQIKKEIAINSIRGGQESRNARIRYNLESDEIKRVEYMRSAIQKKFDNNLDLKEMLLATYPKLIIEKNWWGDILFGYCNRLGHGANMLGKLLMEYRDKNILV